jgi:REP element-mobilizing transposase RayT
MPRGHRVDVLGGLYHVIGRGVERRAIFRSDGDREDFLRRLATVVEEDLRLFAFVLMGNHFHLVAKRESIFGDDGTFGTIPDRREKVFYGEF